MILVLVMVVFFIFGYQVHRKQINETSQEYKIKLKEVNEKNTILDSMHSEAQIEKKRLKEQADVLTVNFNQRWKEVETRINENDQLKHQIFLMQKNCSCGGKNHVSK